MDDTRLLVDVWAATRRATAMLLLKDAAHELKNRLGVVHANVIFMRNMVKEMLQAGWTSSLSKEALAQLQEMDAASQDVVTAIKQVSEAITQAKERAARRPHVGPSELDAAAIVERVLARSVGIFRVPVSVEIQPALPHVLGDGACLCVMLLELIANGENAVLRRGEPDGGVVVKLSLENGLVVLSVEDNGPGLGSLGVTQAFHPSVLAPDGTGAMGLAMCRELAREVGAEVQLLSTPRGVTARVLLRPATAAS